MSNPVNARNCQRLLPMTGRQSHHKKQTHQQTKKYYFTLPLAAGFRQEATGQYRMNTAPPFSPRMRHISSKAGNTTRYGCMTPSISWTSAPSIHSPSQGLTTAQALTKPTVRQFPFFLQVLEEGNSTVATQNFQIFFLQKIFLCGSEEFTAAGSPKGPKHQVTQRSAAQQGD